MSYALTLRHHRSRSDSQIEEVSYRLPKLPNHAVREPVRRFHCTRRHGDQLLAHVRSKQSHVVLPPPQSRPGRTQTLPEKTLVDGTLHEVLASRNNEVREEAYGLLCEIIRRKFRELKILTVDDFNEYDLDKAKENFTPRRTITLPKCVHVKLLTETEKRKRKVDEPTVCHRCQWLRERIQQTWRKYNQAVVYRTGGGYIRNPPINKKVKSTQPVTKTKDPFSDRDWQMPTHLVKDTRFKRPIRPPRPTPAVIPIEAEAPLDESSFVEITIDNYDEVDADVTEDVGAISSRLSSRGGVGVGVVITVVEDVASAVNTTATSEMENAPVKIENESIASVASKPKKKKKMMFGAKVPSEKDSIPSKEAEEDAKSTTSVKSTVKSEASSKTSKTSKKSMFGTKAKSPVCTATSGDVLDADNECVCEAAKAEELRLEEERLQLEREEAEREEADRLAAEEAERLAAEEAERLAAEEAERVAAAEAEAQRLAEELKIERERIAAEEQRIAEEQKAEAERLADEERKENERLEKERLEIERVEFEKAEAARLIREAREKEELKLEKMALSIFGEMIFAVKEELTNDTANEAYMEEMLGAPPAEDEFEEEALPQTPAQVPTGGREQSAVLSSRISSLSLSPNDLSSPDEDDEKRMKSPPKSPPKKATVLKKIAQKKKAPRRMSKPAFMNKPVKPIKKSARKSARKANGAPSTPSTASLPESMDLDLPTIPDLTVSDEEEAEEDAALELPVPEEGRTITLPPLPEYREFSRHNSRLSARTSSESPSASTKKRMFEDKTPSTVNNDDDLQEMTEDVVIDDSAAVKLLARPKLDKNLKKKNRNLSDVKAPLSVFHKKKKREEEQIVEQPEEENVLDFAARFCLISFNRLTKYEKVFKDVVKANPVKKSVKVEEEKEEKDAKMRIPGRETLSEELQKVISDFEKVQFSSDAYQERIANIHEKKAKVERQLDNVETELYGADDDEAAALMEKVNQLAKKLADLKEQGTQYAEKYKKLREKEQKLNAIIACSDIPQDVLNALERNTDALYKIFLKRKGHAMRKKDIWDALTALDLNIDRYEKKFMEQILGLADHEDLDFKMFAIVSSFAEKIEEMDSTVRGLIQTLNVRELEKKLEQCRGLYELVLENKGCYGKDDWLEATLESVELDLQAGRIEKEDADSILSKLDQDGDGEVDYLDYCLYIPLFMEVHDKILADPLS